MRHDISRDAALAAPPISRRLRFFSPDAVVILIAAGCCASHLHFHASRRRLRRAYASLTLMPPCFDAAQGAPRRSAAAALRYAARHFLRRVTQQLTRLCCPP